MAEKRRILLLDDSPITLELTRGVLEERGYAVGMSANLQEFQSQLEQFQPEIILTDLMMPDVSGQDIVRVLKHNFHTEKIPIVLCSSRPDAELAPIAEAAGADGYLSKSHGMEKLGDLLDELCESILW
jgi:twitching motility two-component system response regulator PilH